MKNILNLLLALFISAMSFAQVGIGTTSPNANALLELTSDNQALLLPRVANTAAIAIPANGMMIYDISSNCVKSFENNSWTDCLSKVGTGTSTIITSNCDAPTNGFVGTYIVNTALSGASYKVTITNNSFAQISLTFASTDITLEGASASNITIGTPTASPAFASGTTSNIAAGASVTITYPLTGTPSTVGEITATWVKSFLSCNKTASIIPTPTFVASFATNTTTTTTTNGSIAPVDIISASFISNSNPALLANSLFNANGDFVAPYAGTYTFTFKTWTGSLSGFPRWDFYTTAPGRLVIFIENKIPTGTQVIINLTLTAGQIIPFNHQSCIGCSPTTSINFGNVNFDVSY